MAETADLLLEVGTEELPPRALRSLGEALRRELTAELDKTGLSHGAARSFASPRRLAVLVEDCAAGQPEREIERRGPAVKAAFGEDGAPTKAAEGFARSCGVSVSALERKGTDKGEWLVYRERRAGAPAREILPGIAEEALGRLPIPRRMRWGDSEVQFVRPVHWVVFLFGEEVVPCRIMETEAGRMTHGHRFHHPGAIWISRPADYARALEETGRVVADFDDRRERIRQQVASTAEALGGRPDLDEDLLEEVTALVEWPVPIAGSFEERFLEVPHEALILTMKQNQKYFPLFDAEGGLLSHFVTIANIDSPRPELIKEGNERVIRPRLADVMFFWEQDGRRRLEERVDSLQSLLFEKRLGSMYEKSRRVADLARHIADARGADPERAARAAILGRCDLMTETVYELPEMQGIMGMHQARRDGEDEEVARAIRELYMPGFAGDQLPRTPAGTAVSLADRIDTLVAIFSVGERPTGDKDPFALRRSALGALRILVEDALALDLADLLQRAVSQLPGPVAPETASEVRQFMMERLKGYYAEQGFGTDLFEAVAELEPGSPADLDRRIRAVAAFRKLPEAEALAGGNKRIRNILRKVEEPIPERIDSALFSEPAERDLAARIAELRPEVEPLLAEGRYEDALRVLAGLRGPVDRFFDEVMVMCEEDALRRNRLALLASLSGLFLRVADVSRLQWG